MSAAAALIFPLARAYAEHAGLRPDEGALRGALESRLALSGRPARALFAGTAVLVRGAAPLLFLGKPAGFCALSPDEKEELLARLQFSRRVLVRGLFVGLKSVLAGLCYGAPGGSGGLHA